MSALPKTACASEERGGVRGAVLAVVLLAACTPAPAPRVSQPHPYFQVDFGPHAVGTTTRF